MNNVPLMVAKEFPLANPRDVKNEIFVFYTTNKKLPTPDEIKGFAKERHDTQLATYKKSGGKDMEIIKRNEKDPPSSEGSSAPPVEQDKKVPTLTDTRTAIDSGREFLEKRRQQREGTG